MSTDLSIDQIIAAVQDLDGSLVVAPAVGDADFPELAWGDAFFYYAPDGQLPRTVQPYGTVVTKNYPDDTGSDLDPAGRWRVNVHVGRAAYRELTGGDGGAEHDGTGAAAIDPATPDVVLPHPVYGSAGWIAVVNPGPATAGTVLRLLRAAHEAARARFERRR
ncbi:DUF6194 family protein [Promicromonospora iranensis]|uniref:DUF6194 domain-containing protein n=1 Tax=Promicromonospora iranensis TaxID=1105144 RepID=A0ABU2CQ19_9MICO|nr:DUF6194 family protein [Promicromonospora iranensis]MDR7383434.1 hypothetical protein [Promicromonospora iranensis]